MDACNASVALFILGDDMAQYDGSISINTEIELANAKKELKSLEGSMQKTADKVASLRQKIDTLKDVKTPTEKYLEIQKQIEETERKIAVLGTRQEKFLATGGKESSSTYQRMQYDLEQLRESLPYLKSELQELVDTGKAFTLGSDTEKYAEISSQIEELDRQMQADTERQAELQGQIAEREKYIAQLRENAVSSNQRIIETVERIKELEQEIADLKAAGVTEGYADYDNRIQELSNLKQEVKDYNNNIGQVKESYKKLGNIAKQSFEKVNKSAAKTNGLLSQTGIGLKNILKYGLGIRSLYALFNKLRSAIKKGFSNLYNDANMTAFKSSVDNLKASMLTLKNSFAAAFKPLVDVAIPYIQMAIDTMSRLLDTFGQFTAAITGQKTYTKAIKQTTAALEDQNKAQNKQLSSLDKLNNLSEDSGKADGTKSVQMFEETTIDSKWIGFAENIKQSFLEIFTPLKEAWAEYGDSITGSLSKILKNFKNFGNKIKSTTLKWFANLDWKPLMSSVDKLLKSLQPLIDLILDGLSWAWENILQPFGKWTIEEALPAALDAIGSAIELISNVAEKASPFLKEIWDNFLKPAAGFIADAFVDFLKTLGQILSDIANNETAVSVLTGVAIAIGSVTAAVKLFNIAAGLTNTILGAITAHPIVAAIAAIIAIIVLAITYWDDIKIAIQAFWDVCVDIFSGIGDWFGDKFGAVWDNIKGVFDGIIDFITGVFSGDWEKAWNGIVNVFKSIINLIPSAVEGIINSAIDLINGIIGGINSVTGVVGIPAIPKIPNVSIPKLATGAVIPANKEFLAVLGDQKHGRNLEAPEDLIRQIVREETAKNNQGGEITIKVPLYIDSEQVTEAVVKVDREHFNSTGQPLFSF